MRLRLLVVSAVTLTACLDFDQALAVCVQEGGRCATVDGGQVGSSDSGVADAGGSVTGSRDAGTDAGLADDAGTRAPPPDSGAGVDASVDAGTQPPMVDAGSADAGPFCNGGCVLANMTCVLPPVSRDDYTCGSTGQACIDCATTGSICGSGGVAGCVGGPTWKKFTNVPEGVPTGPVEVRSIWAIAPGEAWFANANTSFVHIFGMTIEAGSLDSQLTSVVATGDAGSATLYVGGVNGGFGFARVFHQPWAITEYAPGVKTAFSDFNPPALRDIWSLFTAGPEVFALGDDMTSHLALLRAQPDGGWLMVTPVDAGVAQDGWGSSETDYYLATADKEVVHISGATVTRTSLPQRPYTVWGTAPSRLWVAGQNGLLLQIDGSQTHDLSSNASDLPYWYELWAADDAHVYVVGETNACTALVGRANLTAGVAHFQTQCLSSTGRLKAIHGTGPNDVWAGTDNGEIWHLSP